MGKEDHRGRGSIKVYCGKRRPPTAKSFVRGKYEWNGADGPGIPFPSRVEGLDPPDLAEELLELEF